MITDLIFEWNNNFPIDRWWREKHNIPFNSQAHRDISYMDVCFEFIEEKSIEKIIKEREKIRKDPYIVGSRNFLFKREISQDISDKEFDEINLDDD